MAAKHTDRFFKTFLAVGFLFVFIGLALIFVLPSKSIEGFVGFFFLALLFISIISIYLSLVLKKGLFLYFGLNLCIFSIGALIGCCNAVALSSLKLWPLLMISFGVTLIPSGYLRFRRMRTIYVIPAIVLCVLGAFFLLFAFNVIKVPFKTFVIYMWPAIMIVAGLILVIYYLYCLYTKNDLIEETDDSESVDFESFESGE